MVMYREVCPEGVQNKVPQQSCIRLWTNELDPCQGQCEGTAFKIHPGLEL